MAPSSNAIGARPKPVQVGCRQKSRSRCDLSDVHSRPAEPSDETPNKRCWTPSCDLSSVVIVAPGARWSQPQNVAWPSLHPHEPETPSRATQQERASAKSERDLQASRHFRGCEVNATLLLQYLKSSIGLYSSQALRFTSLARPPSALYLRLQGCPAKQPQTAPASTPKIPRRTSRDRCQGPWTILRYRESESSITSATNAR